MTPELLMEWSVAIMFATISAVLVIISIGAVVAAILEWIDP